MVDAILIGLLVVAVLLVVDLVVAGGAMTMTGMSAMAGALTHPLVAGLLVALVVAMVFVAGALAHP